MSFDIEGAKRAGYTDDEIAAHLGKQRGFDVEAATRAGYKPQEIISHLSSAPAQPPRDEPGKLTSLAAGAGAGFGNVVLGGQRLLGKGIVAADELINGKSLNSLVTGRPGSTLGRAGDWLVRDAEEGRARLQAENSPYAEANPLTNGGGRLAAEVIATLPVGGVIGSGIKKVGAKAGIPILERLGTATATGGFRTGAAPTTLAGKAANTGIRMGGGAINGGATAGLVDSEQAGTGAIIGAALPPAVQAVSGAARLVGGAARKVSQAVAPLNPKNDTRILGQFLNQQVGPELDNAVDALRRYKQTGPAVPGYQATTAEVSRVPSLAAMQRTATAVDPLATNSYSNTAARNQDLLVNELEELAGRDGQRMFTEAARETTANKLYQQAYSKPIDPVAITKPMRRQIDALMQKPAMQEAVNRARVLAKNEGLNIKDPAGSLRGLHYAKTELDAMIRDAATANEKRILTGLQGDLLKVLDTLSPEYALARSEYAAMSKPVNQFDVLERVADKAISPRRTLTLNAYNRATSDKVAQAALRNPKATMAGTLDPKQFQKLGDLRGVLEGLDFTQNAGRGVGSDTVQKLATANRMPGSSVGGLLSRMPGGSVVGGLLARGADAMYSGANQRLQERLTRGLLDPDEGLALLEAAYPQITQPGVAMGLLNQIQRQGEKALPMAFKTAPVAFSR